MMAVFSFLNFNVSGLQLKYLCLCWEAVVQLPGWCLKTSYSLPKHHVNRWECHHIYFSWCTLCLSRITRQMRTFVLNKDFCSIWFNPLTPNDRYSGRTAPLTSKRYILYIYSTNTGTEYFKHGIYCPFFLFKMQFVS